MEKKDEKTGKTFIEQLSSEQRLSLENEMRKLWYDRSKQGFVQSLRISFSRRSEEHTSELQSLMRISYAVFCLKKKQTYSLTTKHTQKQSKRRIHTYIHEN